MKTYGEFEKTSGGIRNIYHEKTTMFIIDLNTFET